MAHPSALQPPPFPSFQYPAMTGMPYPIQYGGQYGGYYAAPYQYQTGFWVPNEHRGPVFQHAAGGPPPPTPPGRAESSDGDAAAARPDGSQGDRQ